MDIRAFAQGRRLKAKRDECGELVIPGKAGQIYEHSPGRLGVVIMPGRPRVWANAKKRLEAAGFQVIQNGDWEGTALFDPENSTQAQLAMKLIQARRKRRMSEAQRAALAERLRDFRRTMGSRREFPEHVL
jgi:hypothetical protein